MCILSSPWTVDSTMNLISGTHHSCERREHAFMVLRKYTIISRERQSTGQSSLNISIHLFIYFFLEKHGFILHTSFFKAKYQLILCVIFFHMTYISCVLEVIVTSWCHFPYATYNKSVLIGLEIHNY